MSDLFAKVSIAPSRLYNVRVESIEEWFATNTSLFSKGGSINLSDPSNSSSGIPQSLDICVLDLCPYFGVDDSQIFAPLRLK